MVRTNAHPFGPSPRILLDSTAAFDAGLMGYDGPRNPVEDAEGLIVTGQQAGFNSPPWARLQGPDGTVELSGRSEIEQVIKALQAVLAPTLALLADQVREEFA